MKIKQVSTALHSPRAHRSLPELSPVLALLPVKGMAPVPSVPMAWAGLSPLSLWPGQSCPFCHPGPSRAVPSATLWCPHGLGSAVPCPGLAGALDLSSAAWPPSAGTQARRRALPLTGRRPGKTTGSVCIGRSPRLILRGSFSSDLIWTPALPINHGLMRTIHLPALAFNKIEENWSSSRS